jgi:gamma-glutamylcyclotransferase
MMRSSVPHRLTMPLSFLNFAYGSNMSSHRLRERTPSAQPIGIGQLCGHRLVWRKRGHDGSAKCDILQTGQTEDVVWGVLFEIAASEKPFLDQAEGLGQGYDYKTVSVLVDRQRVDAGAYFATDIDNTQQPYDWYVAFVLAGALEHGLPSDYSSALRSLSAVVDPDGERRKRNLAILRDAETSSSRPPRSSGPA